MTTHRLFLNQPCHHLGLKNRIVMSPMTRSRADKLGIPSELAIEYYKQRSNAGLIITEGTSPSPNGSGYPRVPGIYTEAQLNAWKKIVDAIHKEESKIFLQIMHVGRVAHSLNKPDNAETVAPSAIPVKGDKMFTDEKGLQEMDMPRALETGEIPAVVEEYRQATINAFEAGFDGVELHAASGYLPMQFLSSNSNQRTDQYGGSIENRIRFVIEVLEAMCSIKGADKIGIRIWPGLTFNDMFDKNPVETYTALLKAINPMGLAYVHSSRLPDDKIGIFKLVRDCFDGVSIINGGFNFQTGEVAIKSGVGDLVAYATLYLANPDLVTRFQQAGIPLNEPDKNTFYTPGAKGYIDYPKISDTKKE